MRCCARAPPASAHSSPTYAIAPALLPFLWSTDFYLDGIFGLVFAQAIVEVVEACMKGEGANARKHVRLRTPHPSTLPLPHLRSQHVSAASRCWPVWLLLTSLLRDCAQGVAMGSRRW